MKPGFQIEPATVKDADDLENLVRLCYRDDLSRKGWTTEAGMFTNPRVTKDELKADLMNPNVTIFKWQDKDDNGNLGKIVACVKVERVHGNKLHMGMISVHPEIQNGGMGRRLLSKINDFGAQLGCIAIEIGVVPDRKELIAWYERRGYVRTGQTEPFEFRINGEKTILHLVVLEQPIPYYL